MESLQSDPLLRLGMALFVGLLIGFERGWQKRRGSEGTRVAGVRTFGLIGLLGGLWALLAGLLGEILLGFALVVLAAVILLARLRAAPHLRDYGATTIIAALLTFSLGAVAVKGEMAVAAAGAVITALLLGIKPIVHGWLTRISYEELLSVLKLLVMSLVLLPVLPNRGYGPWQALNPYELWLMVILIAGVSFVGYAAVRLAGEKRGVLLASLAGGLVSSTAVAINLARVSKSNPDRPHLLAAGIGVAATTMYPRTLAVAGLIEPRLLEPLILPLGMATLAGYAVAVLLWQRLRPGHHETGLNLRNPFELEMALKFGLLLALILLLAHGLQVWWGDAGVLLLAVFSGLADVDAVNLSLARMAGESLALEIAAAGICLAVVSNTLVKAGIAAGFGAPSLRLPVLLALGSGLIAGVVGFLLPAPAGLLP